MKKTGSAVLILMSIWYTYGQTYENIKVYKNEIGVDATGFIKYFLTFNQTSLTNPYTPTYYLTYRRKFKPGNIRSAVGGSYSSRNIAPMFATDSNDYFYRLSTIDFRIGWEFTNDIGKKSQIYYGIDFRPGYYYSRNDLMYSNGGYGIGYEEKDQYYGFAPLFGYRFKISSRICLTAETSLSFIFSKKEAKRYYTPILSSYPEMPDDKDPTINSFYTSYSQPISVIVTFDL